MNVQRFIVVAVVTCCCAQIVTAATPFSTKRLASVAAAVGVTVSDGAFMGIADDSTWTYRGRPLHVRTNAFGEVSHVGYCLFSRQLVDSYRPVELLDFLERYALELDLSLDGRTPAARMAIDKVICVDGTPAMLTEVTPESPFTVEVIERRMFRVGWTLGGRRLCLTFPADCQLMFGADATELEDIFERNLKRTEPLDEKKALDQWSEAKVFSSGDDKVLEGGQYLSRMIRADLYMTGDGSHISLIADSRKPLQTVTNLLLTGIAAKPTLLDLTVNRYGYSSTKINVTLQQFVALCRNEGCQLYVGVKTHTADEITATIFALNSKLAYNHVLSVRFPLGLLDGEYDLVEATAYAYIPLQNVTEDFFIKDLK